MNVTTRKTEALPFQHETGDTKTATRYEVLVDGNLIGYVSSHSAESRTKTKTRIAGRLRGYSRSWLGHLDTNRNKNFPSIRTSDTWHSNRLRAAEELAIAWQRANTAK